MNSKPIQGVIAILRGVKPDEVLGVAEALIEVPLNSPQPFDSIERLARTLGSQARIGAGTVLAAADVERAADAGATLVLAPNFDAAVVQRTVQRGLFSMPGVATPTEGFAALAAGATGVGVGSSLYAPGVARDELTRRARALLQRWQG